MVDKLKAYGRAEQVIQYGALGALAVGTVYFCNLTRVASLLPKNMADALNNCLQPTHPERDQFVALAAVMPKGRDEAVANMVANYVSAHPTGKRGSLGRGPRTRLHQHVYNGLLRAGNRLAGND